MVTDTTPNGVEYLIEPLSEAEIESMMESDGFVAGNILYDWDDIVNGNAETVTDYGMESLVGGLLSDVQFSMKDAYKEGEGNYIVVEVSGVYGI